MYSINSRLVTKSRLLKGWNQGDLADAAGVSGATISHLESGVMVSTTTIKKVSKALRLKLEDLYIIEDDHAAVAK